jgi:5-(carboxyamino)imidazole ribonucleotide synthase
MVNILGTDTVPNSVFEIPSVTMHWYGKGKRPGRKMGHINVCGKDRAELISRLSQLAEILPKDDFPEVSEYVKSL